MEKCRNATKGEADAQKGVSPAPSSPAGEVGNPSDVVCNLRDEVASQMGTSSKTPFCFMQCRRSPSKQSLSPKYGQSNPAHEDQMLYYIQVRVMLGEGGGDQPPPSHAWTGSLIVNMFQDGLEEWITEAVVLAPGEVILFFRWWLLKEGIPLGNARDVGFCFAGPVNWARREAQVEMTEALYRKVVESLQTVVERELRPGGQDAPKEQQRQTGPHSSIQHQRVDARLGGRCFQSGGEKWQCKKSWDWTEKCYVNVGFSSCFSICYLIFSH